MTLLFVESFDHHGTADTDMDDVLASKWSRGAGNWERVTGRLGGFAGATNATGNFLTFGLPPNTTEIIIGFAIKFREINSESTDPLVVFAGELGNNNAIFRRSTAGKPQIRNNPSNVNYNADVNWRPQVWNYFEIRMDTGTNNSNGSATVHMNGQQVMDITGADFNDGSSLITAVSFQGTDHFDNIYDDIYICDTNGTTNNTFLGDVKVEAMFPSTAGTNSDWSVTGAADNHTAISEEPVDLDTSYVSTSTLNDKDTHAFEDLSLVSQSVKGVQINTWGKKTSTGNRAFKSVVRSDNTDYDQSELYLPAGDTDEYAILNEIVETDPNTSALWTPSGVNNAEFGYKLTT